MIYLPQREFHDPAAFLTAFNKHRLANKGQWIVFAGTVAGKRVEIKSFGHSYLQILNVDGVRHGGGMDMKAGAWKAAIAEAVGA